MPEISRFYGISIRLFANEHPPPHFHAVYGEFVAVVNIHTGAVERGDLPPRARGLVTEWATLHRDDLLAAWNRLRAGQTPGKIEPLR